MIDFCCKGLGTTITFDGLSSDSFDIENLLKDLQQPAKINGFQAERFLKCPATVVVRFSLPIDLKEITIKPWVGSQCGQIINLFVLNDSRGKKPAFRDEEIRYRAAAVKLESRSLVRFHTDRHNQQQQNGGSDAVSCFINANCSSVRAIKIVVARMLTGTVPSIGRLCVSGAPSRFADAAAARSLLDKWHRLTAPPPPPPVQPAATTSSRPPHASADRDDDDDVSELFLDDLTCAPMEVPVLLPSGRRIDQSSLERYLSSLEGQGRTPCDPFTGVEFARGYQPTVDAELKLKIDRFRASRKRKRFDDGAAPPSSPKALKALTFDCCKCGVYLCVSDHSAKYRLPCGHRMCGTCCRDGSSSWSCPRCGLDHTSRHQLVRSHGLDLT